MKPKINSIYLAVKDMDRAISFYEEIFEVEVSKRDKRMSEFELGNLTLLLFDLSVDSETAEYGNNIVPNIEVEGIEKYLDLVKSKDLEIVLPLMEESGYKIFQCKDTEGNILEFYE